MSYSKRVSMIGIAHQVGAAALIENDARGDKQEDIMGACPLLTEVTWYVLLQTFRTHKQKGCSGRGALPDRFGEGIYSKKAFLASLPHSFQPNATDIVEKDEFDGWPAMVRITCHDFAEVSDDWRAIRAVICVLIIADRIYMYGADRIERHGKSPFDIAAAYYRPSGQLAVKK